MSRLLVLGAGGHGKVAAEAAIASGKWSGIAFLDARFPELGRVLDRPVIGTDGDADRFLRDYPECFVAIGDNRLRLEFLARLARAGFRVPAIVHPASCVSPSARIGDGSLIVAGAIVNAEAVLGRGCIVNTAASVDHDCSLGDGVHVAPGARIGGNAAVGRCAWIGIGAAVRHGVRVGAEVTVGAGAAVVCDLPDGVTAMGVPARIV